MTEENLVKIINVLKKHKDGLWISEISRKTKLSRNTVNVYINRLMGQNKVNVKLLGNMKFVFIK